MNKTFYDKVTIIITRHYENRFLIQLLKYFQIYEFPFRIIILDSSDKPIDIYQELKLKNSSLIQYELFNKSINMFEKILLGLEKVATPYSVICSDDDFITVDGILKSVEFLETNKDYSVAHGNYISFETKNKNNEIEFCPNRIQHYNSIEDESCIERFREHFIKYEIPTYSAVHKTELLTSILKETVQYTDDYRFGEILPSLLTIIYGKMKKLDVFYAARRFDISSSGQTLKNIDFYIKENNYKEKYNRFKECIVLHLSRATNIQYSEAENIIDSAMTNYLYKSFGGSLRFIKTKFLIKDILKKLNLSQDVLSNFVKFQKKMKSHKHDFNNQVNSNVEIDYRLNDSHDYDLIKKIVLDGSNNF